MNIFTVENGMILRGATVSRFMFGKAGSEVSIPAILVGENGRGRSLGVLPVQLTRDQQQEWEAKGSVLVSFAKLGKTHSSRPKLISIDIMEEVLHDEERAVCVFRTHIGFRGGSDHTGDQIGERNGKPTFVQFPGEVLVKGIIAQGDAGRMGSGEQMVAIMPKGVVFRTAYSGRLYGEPSQHYYYWDGTKMVGGFTEEERAVADDKIMPASPSEDLSKLGVTLALGELMREAVTFTIGLDFEIPRHIRKMMTCAVLSPIYVDEVREVAIQYNLPYVDGHENLVGGSVYIPWTKDLRYVLVINFKEDADTAEIMKWIESRSVRQQNNGIFRHSDGGDGIWLMPVKIDKGKRLERELVPRK